MAEADPASIPLEEREDLHVKPDPDAMATGHTNGLDIKVLFICWTSSLTHLIPAWQHVLRANCSSYGIDDCQVKAKVVLTSKKVAMLLFTH